MDIKHIKLESQDYQHYIDVVSQPLKVSSRRDMCNKSLYLYTDDSFNTQIIFDMVHRYNWRFSNIAYYTSRHFTPLIRSGGKVYKYADLNYSRDTDLIIIDIRDMNGFDFHHRYNVEKVISAMVSKYIRYVGHCPLMYVIFSQDLYKGALECLQ